MNLMMLGAPGAGKGTLAQALVEADGYTQLIASSLIKELAYADSTPDHLKAEGQRAIEHGVLVSDQYITSLFEHKLSTLPTQDKLIFDGYPRTVGQADDLLNMITIDQVLYLEADEELLMERLLGRESCPKCGTGYHRTFMPPSIPGTCDHCGTETVSRKDDNPETIKYRLQVYKDTTYPILEHLRQRLGDQAIIRFTVTADTRVDDLMEEWRRS